jgi:N-methylhydantoinase B/oxoprolinase/acetone carboxylase alpha subunit
MEVKYNTPIEVTESQYNILMTDYSGIVAGRKEDGKFFVKCLIMKYANYVKKILSNG